MLNIEVVSRSLINMNSSLIVARRVVSTTSCCNLNGMDQLFVLLLLLLLWDFYNVPVLSKLFTMFTVQKTWGGVMSGEGVVLGSGGDPPTKNTNKNCTYV